MDTIPDRWRQIVGLGDEFPAIFYALLFDTSPEAAELFPLDMREQRRHLMAALGRVVNAEPDQSQELQDVLRRLGREHRRFGATDQAHYDLVGQVLIKTMSELLPEWTDEDAAAWGEAYQGVAKTMIEGAEKAAAAGIPPYLSVLVESVTADLDGASLFVTWPDNAPPGFDQVDELIGRELWVCRDDRVGAWRRGLVVAGRPGRVRIDVDVDDKDPESWGLSHIPEAVPLRLALTFDEEIPAHA